MILISHKELAKNDPTFNAPVIHIEREYAESDIIFKRGIDYHTLDDSNDYLFNLDNLKENLKQIYNEAYRNGYNKAINDMMH